MFCGNCGAILEDDAMFCQECGAPVDGAGRGSGKKAGRKPHIKLPKYLISVVAVILAVVLIFTAVSAIFVGPSGKLLKALAKSGKAFLSAAETANLTDLSSLATMKAASMDFDLQLNKFADSPELGGIGVRGFLDTDISGQKIALGVTPYFGSMELVSLQAKLDGEKLYMGSPELTKDLYYMINTVTIGRDLEENFDISEAADLSFNVFELVERFQEIAEENKEAEKDVRKALRTFAKEIDVDKTGSETVEVNDQDLKCTGYHVTITEDSMDTLLDTMKDIYGSIDNTDAYMDILESIGFPDDVLSEMEYSLEDSADQTEYMFDQLEDLVEELGDVELDMYVNKGYVVAAVYEMEVDSTDLKVILHIGGGGNYLDNISLRFEAPDSVLSFTASGNHTGKGGEFTSEMVVEIDGDTIGETELFYAPKEKADNFSFKLTGSGTNWRAEGQISISKNELVVYLDKVKIDSEITFGVDYQLRKYDGDRIDVQQSEALGEMSHAELMMVAAEIGDNATELLEDLYNEIPFLRYLF